MIRRHDKEKFFARQPSRENLIHVQKLIHQKRLDLQEFSEEPRHHMTPEEAVDYDISVQKTKTDLQYLTSLYDALLTAFSMEPTQFAAWQYNNGIAPAALPSKRLDVSSLPRASTDALEGVDLSELNVENE